MTASARVIVFMRYPRAGACKTRLIPALGAERAAQLHDLMARHTLAQCDALPTSVITEVRFAGATDEEMRARFGADRQYVPQSDGDLGERLLQATRSAFQNGAGQVVLIGTDCPGLSTEVLQDALQTLRTHDLVLGPAADGGYYLIGMTAAHDSLFRGIDWGTEVVFEQTQTQAKRLHLKVACLAELADVDRPEDLIHLAPCSFNSTFGPPLETLKVN